MESLSYFELCSKFEVGSAMADHQRFARDQHRVAMRQEFLEAARHVVVTDGEDNLTMQRIVDHLGCSIGMLYRYFPSKDALVAALDEERATTMLDDIERTAAARFGVGVGGGADTDAGVAALGRVFAVGAGWLDVAAAHPNDAELAQRLVVRAVTESQPVADGPAAHGLIDQLAGPLAEAATNDALADGDPVQRAVLLIATVPTIQRLTPEPGDHAQSLGRHLTRCLLGAWGASEGQLSGAEALVGGGRA